MYKHFRFNNRTARQSFLGMVAFPVAVFALAYNQDVCFFLPIDTFPFGMTPPNDVCAQMKWEWTGRRKSETLSRIAPAPESSD